MSTPRLAAGTLALLLGCTGPASAQTGATDRSFTLPANAALGVLPEPTQIDARHSYTLAELIDIAETANPVARGAWDEAKEAAAGIGLARSAFLPRLTAIAAGIAETTHDTQRLNGGAIDGTGNGRSALAALSLQWLLFDFGQRKALLDAARQTALAADVHFGAIHQAIIHDVSVSFYAAASAHDEAGNADTALADAVNVQTAVEARQAQGQTTVVEVARARQASAQARFAAVQAHGHEVDARIALLTAMGVSPLTPIRLADLPHHPLTPQDGLDAREAVSRALSRRPDMQAALAMESAADESVNAARADYRPKVFFASSASYQTGHLAIAALPGTGIDGANNLTGSSGSLLAAVGVSVPLYDGGMRSSHLEQARARADGARARFETVRTMAIHDIVAARTSIDTSLALYAAADELLAAAQTSFDAALGAYRHGVGSLTEVNDAEIALMTARNARSAAYSGALAAAANLALATGNLAETPGFATGP